MSTPAATDTPSAAAGTHAARLVAVTASTGYIGSHVLGPLARAGYRVRAVARTPARLEGRVPEGVEVFGADALDAAAVRASLEGVDTAFYLVHFLGQDKDYAELDRRGATVFADAARDAGVRRVVFLGGLGEDTGGLSEHLSSRHEVGEILASTGVPVVEFRASIVLGSGSTSFEMIRNLVEKLPVMTTPRWVRMPAQPIAVTDIERYLVAAVQGPEPTRDPGTGRAHEVYEVGGPDQVSYGRLLAMYARHRGLRRLVIPVPVLSPGLSGWWLYLFTPRQAKVGRQLAESLKFPTVVTDDSAARDFPQIRPLGAEQAMDEVFQAEDERFARMRWARELAGRETPATFEMEGRYVDSRELRVACPPEAAFDPVACIGGERGWYAYDTLWDVRGFVDIVLGGPGHRRGRRDQYALVEGDYLEWWRVCDVEPPAFLRLEAEMKLPGRGWLQYELTRDPGAADETPSTLVRQTAVFDAKGVLGRLYWYAVIPFHHFVFRGTLAGIERECRALVEGPATCPLPGAHDRSLARRKGTA
jgi:uncharacterized protein YbjT (DUF2867 family)